jgi:hypothetical protein
MKFLNNNRNERRKKADLNECMRCDARQSEHQASIPSYLDLGFRRAVFRSWNVLCKGLIIPHDVMCSKIISLPGSLIPRSLKRNIALTPKYGFAPVWWSLFDEVNKEHEERYIWSMAQHPINPDWQSSHIYYFLTHYFHIHHFISLDLPIFDLITKIHFSSYWMFTP